MAGSLTAAGAMTLDVGTVTDTFADYFNTLPGNTYQVNGAPVQISDAAQPQNATEPVVEPLEAVVDEEAAMPPHNLPAEEAYGFFAGAPGSPEAQQNQEHAVIGGAGSTVQKAAPKAAAAKSAVAKTPAAKAPKAAVKAMPPTGTAYSTNRRPGPPKKSSAKKPIRSEAMRRISRCRRKCQRRELCSSAGTHRRTGNRTRWA